VGGDGILSPPRLKKWGDTSPVSPTKLRPYPGYGPGPTQWPWLRAWPYSVILATGLALLSDPGYGLALLSDPGYVLALLSDPGYGLALLSDPGYGLALLSDVRRNFEEEHQDIIIEIMSDANERGPKMLMPS